MSLEITITICRVLIGTFFAISGYHKLFNAQRHASLVATLTADRVPFIRFNQWWVPFVELAGGLGLAAGLFFPFPVMGLLAICLVATCVDGLARVASYEPVDKADWLDDLLYLPETLYALFLTIFMLHGSGLYSIDALLHISLY